jgi:protein-disulfide isomerase
MGPSDEGSGIGALLVGIQQIGNGLGSPAAPVTLEYFGDLQCPFCKNFTLRVLPSIIERRVRSGQLRIEYRSLETATRDPDVFSVQQVAALASGRQGKAWDFIETFYRDQGDEGSGYVTEAFLRSIASHVSGLDIARWTSDRGDPELAAQIADDEQAAESAGLSGTPSFLIGRTGGTMTTLDDQTSLDGAIDGLLGA